MARKPASNQKSLTKIEGFENFDRTLKGIVEVPTKEVEAEERKYEKKKARRKAKRKK